MRTLARSVLFLIVCSSCSSNALKPNFNDLIPFCELVASPAKYDSKTITTKAILLGYHDFIAYGRDCKETCMVVSLALSFDQRSQVLQMIQSKKRKYASPILNNNIYAEVTLKGTLSESDLVASDPQVQVPKMRLTVIEVLKAEVLSDEILPSAVAE